MITGQSTNGTNYTSNGPVPPITDEVNALRTNNVNVTFANPSSLLGLSCPT